MEAKNYLSGLFCWVFTERFTILMFVFTMLMFVFTMLMFVFTILMFVFTILMFVYCFKIEILMFLNDFKYPNFKLYIYR